MAIQNGIMNMYNMCMEQATNLMDLVYDSKIKNNQAELEFELKRTKAIEKMSRQVCEISGLILEAHEYDSKTSDGKWGKKIPTMLIDGTENGA